VQIEAFALTGAAGEGVNRLIELETRNAFGFRNPSTNAYDHAAQAVRATNAERTRCEEKARHWA
jgi:hypothetical protein